MLANRQLIPYIMPKQVAPPEERGRNANEQGTALTIVVPVPVSAIVGRHEDHVFLTTADRNSG